MSIADLKAALDFIQIDLKSIKEKSKTENIALEEVPLYLELQKIENSIYDELLNKIRFLK